MNGFLYVFFLCVAGVVIPIAIVYWERRNPKIAIRWTIAACVAIALGLFFAAKYYITSPARPYVVFRVLKLSAPLASGNFPTVELQLENISTTNEVMLKFRNLTYYFTPNPDIKTLAYQDSDQEQFRLGPTQKSTAKIPFTNFVITEEQLKAFKERRFFLYFFGIVNYTDESGRTYQLPFCGFYDPDIDGNLSVCNDRIKFK